MKLDYRADIDGLRAIAVLSVVIYHVRESLLTGGFVGVDIFFVISGYLITTIITREINDGKFSLAEFYERRIRRIYPALFAMVLLIVPVSAILYSASNFKEFSKSIIATTFFFSNIHFWTGSGYFEEPAQLKPLLHTWSLAVEEQYYILFPLMVMLIVRYFKSTTPHILTGMALLLFGWNVYALQNDPSGAFYFAHLRAWELLIGSVLALNPVPVNTRPVFRNALSLIGLGMISASIFLYSENTPFPGFAAAIPALGTALILYSGIANLTFVNKLLSIPPLVFVGKISYSLYLWHWPLVIFSTYYAIRRLTRPELVLLLAGIFIISTLSWKFIEIPFRKRTLPQKSIFIQAGAVMMIAASIGVTIYLNNGFPGQQNTGQTTIEDETWLYEPCNFANPDNDDTLKFCPLGKDTQNPTFLLWGDSHASALAWGIHVRALQKGIAGQLIYNAGCRPLLGITANKQSNCVDFNIQTLHYIEAHPELTTIFLGGRWAQWVEGTGYKEREITILKDTLSDSSKGTPNAVLFERGLNRTIEKLLELDRRVVLISEVPEVKYNVATSNFIAQRTGRDANSIIAPSLDEYLSRNQRVFPIIDSIRDKYGIQVLDPWKVLCNENQCIVVVDEKPLYMDADHLSFFGSEYISHIYDPLFDETGNDGE